MQAGRSVARDAGRSVVRSFRSVIDLLFLKKKRAARVVWAPMLFRGWSFGNIWYYCDAEICNACVVCGYKRRLRLRALIASLAPIPPNMQISKTDWWPITQIAKPLPFHTVIPVASSGCQTSGCLCHVWSVTLLK